MHFVKNFIKRLILIVKLTRKFNLKPTYLLFFTYYSLIRLDKLLKMQLKLQCIPDEIFTLLIMKHGKCTESLVDQNLYVLSNCDAVDKTKQWFYLCCKYSKRKYKIAVIFTKDIAENVVYVSESMKTNIHRHYLLKGQQHLEEPCYFLIPETSVHVEYASEVKISLITNPHDCKDTVLNSLLQKYFSAPKYLRTKDIFKIDVKKLAPEIKYCTADSKLQNLYFVVKEMKNENSQSNTDGGFVFYGRSTLIQETNINSYLPRRCFCDIPFDTEKFFKNCWPSVLKDTLQQVQASIDPFLQKDININVRPIFLVEGPTGSGKSKLVKTVAETLGLHMIEADFTEVQSLTSAQTEAKLRIILNDAEMCVPCILMLKNIQVFGLNSEGQKDERVLSAFSYEMKKLYSKKRNYPIIIIATTEESDIQIDTERNFIEKITINHLDQEQRCDFLSWLIKSRGLKHQVDLQKVAKMCSDFVLADLEVLVLHAVKNRFKLVKQSNEHDAIELSNDDFVHACEYMQFMFSDQIGAPRVPKVNWEDIGGLADLKREIMRRIEMPLLNISGMGRSGLLLYGPPGTGKTLLAKAVATECQLHFLSVKGPELLNMYVGQSEKNVRQVFERARAASPCIIFFDELDSLAPNRGKSGDSGGVMDRVVSQLLAEMDGLESAGRVFIIGATNRPDLIDPALLRPGRFDKMLYVGIYADPDSQLAVLKAVTRHFRLEREGRELEELVSQLPDNLTGADLHSVCSNAWLAAVRRIMTDPRTDKDKVRSEDVIVELEDFIRACKDLVPSVSKEELLRYERLKNELSAR